LIIVQNLTYAISLNLFSFTILSWSKG